MNRLSTAGELTASIAHDLRQPLSAILINSEAAEFILKSDTPDIAELQAIVSDIKRDDRRANDVITQLRGFLMRAPVEAQDVDLNDLIKEVFGFLSPQASARQIVLSTNYAQPSPQVRGVRIQLQQVVLNLLLNAIDAMGSANDGQRTIVGRTAVRDHRLAEVSIEDSGPGIPAGKENQIFQPFFTTKDTGMGMGLSIARTIVESYGGRISAANRDQGGAVFRFVLPLLEGRQS